MTTDLLAWDENDQTLDPDAEYRMLLNGLRRTEGFGLFFVECSPFQGEKLIKRTRKDLRGKRVDVLKLEAPISDGNLFKRIKTFLDEREETLFTRFQRFVGVSQQTDVLFIQGLELSLLDYEESKKRLGWSSEKIFSYSWHGVPPVLINLNQQRERFRDSFATRIVFLLPVFAVKYLVHRAPDFFDWRSGVAQIADDTATLSRESRRLWLEGGYSQYLSWTQEQRNRRILEIQSLLEAEKLDESERVNLHFEQGNLFDASMEWKAAIAAYNAALAAYDAASAIQPDDPEALYNKDLILKLKGLTEQTVLCEKEIALNELGHYEEAIAAYDAAITIKPDDHEVLYLKGVALGNLGRNEEAIAAYNAALAAYDAASAIQPDDPEALYNKDLILKLKGLTEQIVLCEKEIALNELGHYEEAIAAYDAAITIKPDDHEVLYLKGVALGNLGRYEEAIAAYDAAITIKPDLHKALYLKGIALWNLGRHEEAIAAYNAAIAIQPDNHEAWDNKGYALANAGQLNEAISSFDKAIEINPQHANAIYNKAYALSMQGDLESAFELLQQAFDIDPNYREMAKTDTDFDPIRADPRFQALLER
ncbi:tetratricopeptide repeat protein [Nodosilinea sp. LEGE 07088]|uniref:tetratricopeptide repeat protein n=1 Tax=Nodosilinea sp. LEGE 07088 TaxID=2777968 RepID=UPI001880216D|nr:tetratricopeptide repeat protein [Nodosilinea sp. LEGE 07088]MBE9141068.1 tetratricopeptide repeat protein [Nodosilinea sp. LEGE 07088]